MARRAWHWVWCSWRAVSRLQAALRRVDRILPPMPCHGLDDAALAAETGAFVLTDGRVRYVAHASKAMTYLGKPVTSLDLVSDVAEKPTELVAGSLHVMLIERGGPLGI